jgi:DNA-binding transcriptional regulator YdaS (Cro superfamily)
MRLKDWQKTYNIKDITVADDLGIDASYVSHINANRKRPAPDLAFAIEKYTRGEVTRLELLYPDQT